jgi:glycosyltransferase involved in cell wall biosynthesis
MKNVLILYKSMPQYRLEFFSILKERLKADGIHIHIVYGDMDSKGKSDNRQIEFGQYKANRFIRLGKSSLIWQPCVKELKHADLVIVEQASKLLINYVLIIRRLFKRKKFAFWGHGLNMQTKENSLLNKFKKSYSGYTDHWFAYTPKVMQKLIDNGYDERKITVVNNAIDTRTLKQQYASISEMEVTALKQDLQIDPEDIVFIYCGALYKEKRLDFLLETADILASRNYKFKLLIVGGGPDQPFIDNAAITRPWLKVAGPKFGREKALYFRASDLFLMPGAIGLAILDSFAFATPMITTRYEYHGPEFEYLVDSFNGIITENNQQDYVYTIFRLLENPALVTELKQNCFSSADKYTVENMVDNFCNGIHKALS